MSGQKATPLRGGAYKRPFDLAVLLVANLVLSPLWLILWTLIPLLIWLEDRGPVFFRQDRVGKNGKIINILKFRTMVPNADQCGPAWTEEGDSRVTKIGRILRRTGLDELPEIINICKGDMSLVGPRPLDLEEQGQLEREIPNFGERLCMLPGLTGLAQVYDQTDDAKGKFYYDLEYAQHLSPWLDVKLLAYSAWNTLVARWDRRSGKSTGESNRQLD